MGYRCSASCDVIQGEDSLGWKDELKFGDTEFMLPARATRRITFMMSHYVRQLFADNCFFENLLHLNILLLFLKCSWLLFLDIDECATGRASCPRYRQCVNTFGSYICKCHKGFDLMYIGGRYQCHGNKPQPLHGVVFSCGAERSLNYNGDWAVKGTGGYWQLN